MSEKEDKVKIVEFLGSSFSFEVKNLIRFGTDLSKKYLKMVKHIDNLFILGLLEPSAYKAVLISSINTTYQMMGENLSTLQHYLPSVLTNVQAYEIDSISIQKTNIDDREIIPYLNLSLDKLVIMIDKHLEDLEVIKNATK